MNIQGNNKKTNISTIILAGGKGTRLYPLTLHHSKPAISYGGRYKLIDVSISNSLNSNIRQIYVIGQYLTYELQHHLNQTYQFDNFFPGSIDFITPEELPLGKKLWFNGTADAIRKSADKIFKDPSDYFLILSGDQLYNINFQKMFSFAVEKDSDLTIAALPVSSADATRMGVLKIDKDAYITDFIEKPQKEEILDSFALHDNFFKQWHVPKTDKTHLGSTAIYIFKRKALEKLLQEEGDDFGKDLIPSQLKKGKTTAFIYNDYWEDIGTISSYYNANISLTSLSSYGLKTYDEKNPIYTSINHLPGTKIKNTTLSKSIICEGGNISAAIIINSIIGLRSNIKKNSTIHNSILMGNSSYASSKNQKLPDKFEIGENCILKNAIIDEHVWIKDNVKLVNKNNIKKYDGNGIYIRDGIIIVTAGVTVPENFEL